MVSSPFLRALLWNDQMTVMTNNKVQAIQHWQRLQSSTKKKLYNPVGWTFYTSSYTSCLRNLCTHSDLWSAVTRFAWWRQDLHAIELLSAHIGEWTITRMLDYWWVMCFTGYQLNWNPWIWIPFPIDSDCTLLCSPVDRTRYSSIASGNNCIVQLCKCVSLHL
jgi:hypothetical protein